MASVSRVMTQDRLGFVGARRRPEGNHEHVAVRLGIGIQLGYRGYPVIQLAIVDQHHVEALAQHEFADELVVEIEDDDVAGVTVSISDISVTESGSTVIVLALNTEPVAPVTVSAALIARL